MSVSRTSLLHIQSNILFVGSIVASADLSSRGMLLRPPSRVKITRNDRMVDKSLRRTFLEVRLDKTENASLDNVVPCAAAVFNESYDCRCLIFIERGGPIGRFRLSNVFF
jgi:hypothetical protein